MKYHHFFELFTLLLTLPLMLLPLLLVSSFIVTSGCDKYFVSSDGIFQKNTAPSDPTEIMVF